MKRRFWAFLLVLGLLFGAVASSDLFFSGSQHVVAGKEFRPTMRVPAGVDLNFNRISDGLDLEITQRATNRRETEPVNVIVMLNSKSGEADVDAFASAGGFVQTGLWEYALYGFGGRIPFGQIVGFVNSHSNVLLVEKEAECQANVAYAAQQVGARSYVWNTLGLQGDSNSAIAVLDTGIDGSHVDFSQGFGAGDFSKKIVGWSDQVGSLASPYDDNGHGSHCSGLAGGDGFLSVNAAGYATGTWGANLGRITSSGTSVLGGMMVNKTGPVTVSVQWSNTGTGKLASLALYNGSKSLSTGSWSQLASVSTPNKNTWYTFTFNVASTPSGGYDMYHVLGALTAGTGNLNVMFNFSWPYMPPSDGFSAWTGLAPDSRLVGVKVLNSAGSGTTTQLLNGLNWLVANRVTYHVTVASMSLGFTSEISSVDAAIVNLVNSGVSTIVAAGNSGSGANYIYTPGSVDEVLTVAAMNQFDGVASYSSQGGTSRYTGLTVKPDVTAPGGSFYAVPLFSADSNYNEGDGAWSDVMANDSAPMQGTSMATPVVAGAAQTLVDALGGFAGWNYTRVQALTPKMLLLMTATETYPNVRDGVSSGISPTLERGGKDAQEGYGRINVDAAADAVLKRYETGTTIVDSLGLPPSLSDISVLGQRLAWARNVELLSGVSYNFSLSVPVGADYDLYLYNTTGNAYGEPVILTKSTSAAVGGKESIMYTPTLSGEYFVVVKRATEAIGGGQFSLTSTPSQMAHLLLSVEPSQVTYLRGQSVTISVNVLNQLSPTLDSTLSLTVDGPGSYYYFDFQTINVTSNAAKDYEFVWSIPEVVGTYVVEVSTVPAMLTAYDVVWLEAT